MIIMIKLNNALNNCWGCGKQGSFMNCKVDTDKDFFVGECVYCKAKRFISAERMPNGEAIMINSTEKVEDFIVSIL